MQWWHGFRNITCCAARWLRRVGIALSLLGFVPTALAALSVTVTLDGLPEDLKANALAYLRLDNGDITDEAELQRRYRAAPEEIRTACEALGYYAITLESRLDALPEGRWQAQFTAQLGEPVRVGTLDLQLLGPGVSDPLLTTWQVEFPLKVGEVLRHDRYEQGKKLLVNQALEYGYLDGQYAVSELLIDPKQYTATVRLHYQTGPRYQLGAVTFSGSTLRPAVLQRYVPYTPDVPYQASLLAKLQENLYASGYFDAVDAQLSRNATAGQILPVQVHLTPRARKKLSAGLGFATDSGPRFRVDWENRQLNSLGHTLGAGLELSGIRQGLSLNYGVPRNSLDERLDYQASLLREETDTALETSFKLGVQHSFKRGEWQRNLFTRYQGSAFEIGGEESTSHLLLAGANWTRTRRDDPVYPTQGSRLFFEVQASEPLLSSTWLVQGRAQAKWLRPIGAKHSVLLRGEVGATWVGDFDQVPASLRFFTGGDDSVRGYSYNSLSPEDADGTATGGRYLLTGSAEYRYQFSGNWGAAVFYDTGGAFNESGDELSHAVGLGARWRSPVGPVSIDLGFGLDEDSSIRLHLRVGPDL